MNLLPKKKPPKQLTGQIGDAPGEHSSGEGQSGERHANTHEGIGRGMEFAVLVLLFCGVGYLLDRWFDTKPVFTIVLAVLAILGQFASLYYNYDERMKDLERIRAEGAQRGRSKLP